MSEVQQPPMARPRRKRSQRLVLAAMGVASVTLSACGQAPNPQDERERVVGVDFEGEQAYRSVDECVAADVYTRSTCEDAYRLALEAAPRFTSLEACEARFGEGSCEAPPQPAATGQQGGGWFMPAMMGYMVGNMMSNTSRGRTLQQVYQEPVYRDRGNRGDWDAAVVGASSRTLSRQARMEQNISNQERAYRNRMTTSSPRATQRSGFGSRSAARGGWGS
ncbi:DUF1190 domain-containing protein [Halomonas sp. 328]|uniref:DUF1190 domain-containing protein n=1 Tax=Halomonas sp. 328 TaxID=2776704 RepID=UPI001E3E31CE|nr:DUF1190 domain-containing protein [Halomonas sp. 328]